MTIELNEFTALDTLYYGAITFVTTTTTNRRGGRVCALSLSFGALLFSGELAGELHGPPAMRRIEDKCALGGGAAARDQFKEYGFQYLAVWFLLFH